MSKSTKAGALLATAAALSVTSASAVASSDKVLETSPPAQPPASGGQQLDGASFKYLERESRPGLRVRSCSPGGTFRRGGIAFDHTPCEIALDDLTEAQFEAIANEPLLVVEKIWMDGLPPQAAQQVTQ